MGPEEWQAVFTVSGLSQEQINDLMLRIVDLVEQAGGFVAGGFIQTEDGSDVQEDHE